MRGRLFRYVQKSHWNRTGFYKDKTAPFDSFYFNSVLVGEALSMEERRKSNGYGCYDASFGLGGIVMRTVTV